MILYNDVAGMIPTILEKCSESVEHRGQWRWSCAIQNGSLLPVAVAFEDGFLRFSAALASSRRVPAEQALDRNHSLAAAGFALDTKTNELVLKAEIVLEAGLLLRRTAAVLDSFHEACEWLATETSQPAPGPGPAADARLPDLVELLQGTPWSITELGPNEFSVDLEAEKSQRAHLTVDRFGVDAKVELLCTDSATVHMRQALAVMLLTANGALRLVRAYSAGKGGQTVYGFQFRLPPDCTGVELDHGLAAMSTASRLCAREAAALLDDTLAGHYLAIRGVERNP